MSRAGRVGVAVIGAGTISDQYLTNLTAFPDVEVLVVADLFTERAAEQAAKYGVPGWGSIEAALEHPDVEIVVNLTIPAAHAEVSLAAMNAGKHVWTEKPFALDRASGRELLATAERLGLRIGGAPDTVLGAGMQTARRLIEAGEIGTPLTGLTLFEVPGPQDDHRNLEVLLSTGAGPLFDMGPYYLTALSQVFGSFDSVIAQATTARPERIWRAGPNPGATVRAQVPTHVSVLSEFAGAGSATSVLSWDSPHGRVGHVEITGTEGTLSIPDPNMFDGDLRLRRAGDPEWRVIPAEGAVGGRGLGVLDIARAIRAGVDHRITGALAYHVLDTMTAAAESIESRARVSVESAAPHSAVVPLEWDPYTRTL
ncbi:gfo/Idh/MocA family oxidoreductase [Mycetocola tolaasinivorans]|uniref:Gfo/Idh/MocA family oxidoreductase n=1 Tax=Mycetocola tolaasinivorans TaxID=76635 RepID=A0A3L7A6X2_9MICO|nr:Gfo/Idh/MocA family oxidoreductase [Mycetocola tolaasinivorans]RLP75590.1 gfo/Idh/MocA family oxidoreductase [Mycetocola tolaasinivorans]